MSMIYGDWLTTPSPGVARETAENNFLWGKPGSAVMSYGVIVSGAARDTGNTGTGGATTILRAGLAMGQITSSSKYVQFDPTATDGSQYFAGFLAFPMKMLDADGNNIDRTGALIVWGQAKAAKVFQALNINSYGITNGLRAAAAGRFIFDDDLVNSRRGDEFRQEVTKTASYTVVAGDSGVLFDNAGAVGAVTFTLPAIASAWGLRYGFSVQADQNVTIASAAGDDMIVPNDASADSVAFSTAGDRIGAVVVVYANPAGTKWIVEKRCSNAMTIAT